jgi:lipopolysaccharide/colanic/teichoic acid biosynthesis glycosyltransferase
VLTRSDHTATRPGKQLPVGPHGSLDRSAAKPNRPIWGRIAKRSIDVVGSLSALLVGMPLLIGVALVVLIFDGRPIFFPWDVIGENGRPFRGYKFRTMVVGADALRASLSARNEMHGPVFKMRHDPRVTRLGGLLRKYSLDELPQLWSVLKGDMSLVGPRPLGPQEYAEATPFQRRKLSVVPGITCLWQVSGRSEISDFDAWVALDLQYIERWSILLDLKILIQTIPAVIARRGAW